MLDFILIRQKNALLELLWEDKFEEVLSKLEFVKELWEENRYGYKYVEIKRIMADRVFQLIGESTHWKQEQKWREMLSKVRA